MLVSNKFEACAKVCFPCSAQLCPKLYSVTLPRLRPQRRAETHISTKRFGVIVVRIERGCFTTKMLVSIAFPFLGERLKFHLAHVSARPSIFYAGILRTLGKFPCAPNKPQQVDNRAGSELWFLDILGGRQANKWVARPFQGPGSHVSTLIAWTSPPQPSMLA